MPENVLHILGTAQPEGTGIASIVGALARGLDPARYKVHAWFLNGGGVLATELRAAGAEVRVVDWRSGTRDPAGAWRFWRSLRGKDFTIIHQHWGCRSLRWVAHRATRARLIVQLHLESSDPAPGEVLIWGADRVIVDAHAVAKQVADVRSYVVYPGVVIRSESTFCLTEPRTAAGKVLGAACRLVPTKGLLYLIRALGALHAGIPGLRLEIAGVGPERSAIESEMRLLGLDDCVDFLGWQADLATVMAGWDVFVHPSLEEGAPIGVLMAMAAGLPVVATAVGGVAELVEDGRTGWVVPPSEPAALADRIRALILDPEQRLVMGAAGRDRVREHFSTDRMVAAISDIYDDLLGVSSN